MSRARLLLHLCALLAPLAVIAVYAAFNQFDADIFKLPCLLALPAAQVVAWLSWTPLEARARRGLPGWRLGAVMALVTHLGFGIAGSVFITMNMLSGDLSDSLVVGMYVVALSLLFGGWVSIPLTMMIAQAVVRMRRREIQHVVA